MYQNQVRGSFMNTRALTALISSLTVIFILLGFRTSSTTEHSSVLKEPSQAGEAVNAWIEDIDFVVERIQSLHPNPWHRVTRDSFLAEAGRLKADIPALDEEEIIVRSMQLAALLHDGHTVLTPYNHPLITTWFPLRLDQFADGLFITVIDKEYAAFVGSKVLRIGDLDAEESFDLVGSVTPVDSHHGLPRVVPTYMSNATILRGLNIIQTTEALPLEVVLPDGRHSTVTLPSVRCRFDGGWARDKRTAPGVTECVTVFDPIMNNLPLHLKRLLTIGDKYWFLPIPEHNVIYFQFNSVTNGPEPFDQFVKRLWDFCDEHSTDIEKLIIDLRYNEGGDGTLLKPLLHELIKHDELCKRGSLFVIIGRNTFSAGSNLVGQMIKYTDVITVGEPTAGPLNWYSDIERLLVPSGRLGLDVSTMYWQEGHPLDARGYCPPEYPVLVTAEDMFSGRDAALERILKGEVVTLADVLRTKGADAFVAEYERRSMEFQSHEWWFPYTVFDLRKLGVELYISGRKDDAISVFELNTSLHPDVYWTWEILGNVYEDVGRRDRAIKCLEKAVELNPHDVFSRQTLDRLAGDREGE
jgi:hypothetical protein